MHSNWPALCLDIRRNIKNKQVVASWSSLETAWINQAGLKGSSLPSSADYRLHTGDPAPDATSVIRHHYAPIVSSDCGRLDSEPSWPLAYLYPLSTVVRVLEAVFCTSQAKVVTSVIKTAALPSCYNCSEVPVWRLGIFKDRSDFLQGKKPFLFFFISSVQNLLRMKDVLSGRGEQANYNIHYTILSKWLWEMR